MAIVKMWKVDEDDEWLCSAIQAFIVSGIEIEAQDRCGTMILGIVARRGQRSATAALLLARANPNACSYSGKIVLHKAMDTTRLATKKDMLESYRNVLSFILILGDYGTVAKPDVILQWISIKEFAVAKARR